MAASLTPRPIGPIHNQPVEVNLQTSAEPVTLNAGDWRGGLSALTDGIVSSNDGVSSGPLFCDDEWQSNVYSTPPGQAVIAPWYGQIAHECDSYSDDDLEDIKAVNKSASANSVSMFMESFLYAGPADFAAYPNFPRLMDINELTPVPDSMFGRLGQLINNFEGDNFGIKGFIFMPTAVAVALPIKRFATRVGNRLVTASGHVVVPSGLFPAEGDPYVGRVFMTRPVYATKPVFTQQVTEHGRTNSVLVKSTASFAIGFDTTGAKAIDIEIR